MAARRRAPRAQNNSERGDGALFPGRRDGFDHGACARDLPVSTVQSVEDGLKQAKALVAGGLYAIEVTLRTPSALLAIAAIARHVPDAVVGAAPSFRPSRSTRRSLPARAFW